MKESQRKHRVCVCVHTCVHMHVCAGHMCWSCRPASDCADQCVSPPHQWGLFLSIILRLGSFFKVVDWLGTI